MTARKVYRLKAGHLDRLKISEESLSPPDKDEVQIQVKSIGLNFADVFAILGLYSATPKGPFIPGLEYAGVISAKGDRVTGYDIGDRVMGVTRFGAYASHININQAYISPLLESWNFNEGASYLVQVLTAYYGLSVLAGVREDHTVLIHSAAGGVGIWANRICKNIGAYTIGTIGHENKVSTLQDEGYDTWLIRDQKTFKHDLSRCIGDRSLDIIMECIGGRIMKIGYEALAPMGRHIVYGSAHYGDTSSRPNYFKLIPKYLSRPRLDPQNMIKENKGVLAFNLIYLFEHVHIMQDLLAQLQKLDLGRPIIRHTFSLEELPKAIRLFQSGKTVGKVVVEI